MTENLEPGEDPATVAIRKMMQPEPGAPARAPTQGHIETLYVLALTSLAFWIEQGVPIEGVCNRIDNIANILPLDYPKQVLSNLEAVKAFIVKNAPDHLKG
jgi:hypothetical protein